MTNKKTTNNKQPQTTMTNNIQQQTINRQMTNENIKQRQVMTCSDKQQTTTKNKQ